jgi:hypothetical protein
MADLLAQKKALVSKWDLCKSQDAQKNELIQVRQNGRKIIAPCSLSLQSLIDHIGELEIALDNVYSELLDKKDAIVMLRSREKQYHALELEKVGDIVEFGEFCRRLRDVGTSCICYGYHRWRLYAGKPAPKALLSHQTCSSASSLSMSL